MMKFEASPPSIAVAASHVGDLAVRAQELAACAARMANVPVRQAFPALDEGQEAARVWGDARVTFANGLGQVASALTRLSAGLGQAAHGYAAADQESAKAIGETA